MSILEQLLRRTNRWQAPESLAEELAFAITANSAYTQAVINRLKERGLLSEADEEAISIEFEEMLRPIGGKGRPEFDVFGSGHSQVFYPSPPQVGRILTGDGMAIQLRSYLHAKELDISAHAGV
jgi:hypothetical protein